jgi:manganese-dependent inorganic pyrophosphatase
VKEIQNNADLIQRQMNEYAEQKGADLLIAAFTSVLDKGTVFFGAGEKAGWITEAYPDSEGETHTLQGGVLSRKSQILPRITAIIDQYA